MYSAGSLARYVQRKLSLLNIWSGPFVHTRDNIKKGMYLCEHWVTVCETLTSHYWKRFPLHPWQGEKFTPVVIAQLAARLEEVKYELDGFIFDHSRFVIVWGELLIITELSSLLIGL